MIVSICAWGSRFLVFFFLGLALSSAETTKTETEFSFAPQGTEQGELPSDDGETLEESPTPLQSEERTKVPLYQLASPSWGLEIAGSYAAFSNSPLGDKNPAGVKVRAFSIQWEYQPTFLQDLGVLGIGPSLSVYPVTPMHTLTTSYLKVWSAGMQLRYQARFFTDQILVPIAGYSLEYLRYSLLGSRSGSLLLQGPFIGGWFLLNILEPSSATLLYTDHGISRSYLVAELRLSGGKDDVVRFSGNSLFFGLRIEY